MDAHRADPFRVAGLYKLVASGPKELQSVEYDRETRLPSFWDYAAINLKGAAEKFLISVWGEYRFKVFQETVPSRPLRGIGDWLQEMLEETKHV
jgi:hypothetical protein